jgi:hypothetical protein
VFLFVFPQLPSTDYHLSTLITSIHPFESTTVWGAGKLAFLSYG